MGIESRTLEQFWIECDRCHIITGEDDDCRSEDEARSLAHSEGWRERRDGGLKPIMVWLCDDCLADVMIEQGEA